MFAKLLGQSRTDVVRDLFLLACRVLVGGVLIAHGKQKLDAGVGATAEMFSSMGVPAAEAAAVFAMGAELVGGALLILGLLTPLAGLWVAGVMGGAYWYVHKDAGLFAAEGGWELVAVIAAAALALGLLPGRLAIDQIFVALAARSRRGKAEPEAA